MINKKKKPGSEICIKINYSEPIDTKTENIKNDSKTLIDPDDKSISNFINFKSDLKKFTKLLTRVSPQTPENKINSSDSKDSSLPTLEKESSLEKNEKIHKELTISSKKKENPLSILDKNLSEKKENHSLSPVSKKLPSDYFNFPKKRNSFQLPMSGTTSPEGYNTLSPRRSILGINQPSVSPTKRLSKHQFSEKKGSRGSKENKLLQNTLVIKKKTFYDVIANFYLSKKFINILKNITSKRTPKWLNDYHFDLIGDISFFQDVYRIEEFNSLLENNTATARPQLINFNQHAHMYSSFKTYALQKNWGKFFLKYWDKFTEFKKNKLTVFDPSKTTMLFWDGLVLFCIFFYFILIPLEISFGIEFSTKFDNLYLFEYFSVYILFFNVLIKFNTSYYRKGIIVQDRLSIARYYMREGLFRDLISVLPILLRVTDIFQDYLSNYLMVIFFGQMINFNAIIKKFEELIFFDKKQSNTLALVKLIIRILIVSHVFACLWHLIGIQTSKNSDSWLSEKHLLQSEWYIRYLHSYYYICVTMNTVGYGDINPVNSYEVLFNILLIYIACALFAYSLNSIGLVVADIMRQENEFKSDLNTINDFMREKNVGFDLQMRIRKYLEYIWHEEKIDKVENQGKIIEKLSDSLKDELLVEANGSIIRDIKMLSLNFSEDTLRQTVSIMKEVRYTPGDLIFMKDDINNKAIYIIRKGEIEIFLETPKSVNTVTVLKKLKEGDVFGEIAFFSDRARSACARSTDFTTVFMIKQDDFINIVKKYSRDFEKYNEIKDNINIYNDYSDIFFKCFACNENTHPVKDCSMVHNVKLTEIVISKYIYTHPQERKEEFRRKKKKCLNAKKSLMEIEQGAYKIQDEIFPAHLTSSDSSNNSETDEEPSSHNTIEEEDERTHSQDSNTSINDKSKDSNEKNSLIEKPPADTDNPNENHNKMNRRKSRKQNILFRKSLSRMNSRKSVGNKNNSNNISSNNYSRNNSNEHDELEEFMRKFENSKKDDYSKSKSMKCDMNYDTKSSKSIRFDDKNDTRRTSNNNSNSAGNRFFNFLKSFLDYSKNKQISTSNSQKALVATVGENPLDLDRIKSFDFYFPSNNIENILDRIEFLKFEKLRRKTKSRKTNPPRRGLYINQKSVGQNDVPNYIRGSFLVNKIEDLYEATINLKAQEIERKHMEKGNGLMRKNFFKNANNLEKLLQEEQFDPEKIKEFYIKKYMRGKTHRIFGFNASFLLEKIKKIWKAIKCWNREKKNQLPKKKLTSKLEIRRGKTKIIL